VAPAGMSAEKAAPKVAVAVITHNGKRYLKTCIESLLNQTYKNFDIYLIDNASSDGSSEYVKQNFPMVKIIRFEKNLGFAKAYNIAIRMIDADYIALLNDDTKVHPKWLEELVKAALEDEKAGALGALILFLDHPDIVQHAGGMITPIGGGIDIGFGKPLHEVDLRKRYVGYVCGAAMLVNKDAFEKVGGFDNDYFAYFEDVDLCWRMWLQGYKVVLVPTSVVYHKYGGSWGGRYNPRRLYLSHINKLRNTVKNFDTVYCIKGLLLNVIFDISRLIILVIKHRRINSAKIIIKVWLTFIGDLKTTFHKRMHVMKKRKVRDSFIEKYFLCSLLCGVKEYLRLDLKK
jgi:GT2 family glycosyltransferase